MATEREYQREYQRKWLANHPNYQKNWREKNPDYNRNRRAKYQEARNTYARNYRITHPEQIKESRAKAYQKRLEKDKAWKKQYCRKMKILAINHYEGKCACCGETHIEFLAIDHSNGEGCKWRKEMKITGGLAMYRWLINNNFPEGFRVLCHNCNQSMGMFGYCPHQNP